MPIDEYGFGSNATVRMEVGIVDADFEEIEKSLQDWFDGHNCGMEDFKITLEIEGE